MSALGQKQTSRPKNSMSALPPKATLQSGTRMSALCQKRTPALQQKSLAIRSPRRQGQVVCLESESQALLPS
jgi:hypothetical protein